METTTHTLNPAHHRGLGVPGEDRVGVVETLQELHCRIRPGTLREFNIKLLDLMSETGRKGQAVMKLMPSCAPRSNAVSSNSKSLMPHWVL